MKFPPGINMSFMPTELVKTVGSACCVKQPQGESRSKNASVHRAAAAIIDRRADGKYLSDMFMAGRSGFSRDLIAQA